MATNISSEDLLKAFETMTVLELSEFLKVFEEKFGVTAAAPVVAMAAAGGDEAGDKKIQVIKEVRSLTSLGLKEAKSVVDDAPGAVLEAVDKETAEKAKAALEGVGAMVEVK